MPDTIPSGPYFGFTLPELRQELVRYKAAVKQAGSPLAGASVNGQSFSFGPRRDMSLSEWQIALQDALAHFGEADAAPGSTAVVRFV